MLQIKCTLWMKENTQSKATQRTCDNRVQLQLQLIQAALQKQRFFRISLGPLWQFKVASLMEELLQQWEKLCAIKLKNVYFSSPIQHTSILITTPD